MPTAYQSRTYCDFALERIAEAERTDPPMAPFAAWPTSFDIRGRCPRCDQMEWLDHFNVWPSPRQWPPIATSNGAYCRACMLIMGVGSDERG